MCSPYMSQSSQGRYSEDGNTYTGPQQLDPQQWKLVSTQQQPGFSATMTNTAKGPAASNRGAAAIGGLVAQRLGIGPTYTYQRIQQQAPAPAPEPAAPAPAPRDYGTPIWREAGNALTIN